MNQTLGRGCNARKRWSLATWALAVLAGWFFLGDGPVLAATPELRVAQFATTDDAFLRIAQPLWRDLESVKAPAWLPPDRADAVREVGKAALLMADEAYGQGSGPIVLGLVDVFVPLAYAQSDVTREELVAFGLLIGQTMLDVLVSANPVTGTLRDVVEAFTGEDLLTGEALTEAERALRVVSAGASFVTLGWASTVKGAMASMTRIGKKMTGRLAARGGALAKAAGRFENALHALDRPVRKAHKFEDITKAGSVTNLKMAGKRSELEATLERAGYKKGVSADGVATNWEKGNRRYSFRDAKDGKPPAADYFIDGKPALKVRFEP